ncbi:DUF4365 domain-containing protein [Allomuricauda taeanensis]|uniref:DUF4365 domain-containing protein n=1 Tax=Flagellimonas taeanensis TaxID=1005926 RepID=UPI002E7BC67D|nr:DUF4365 domain-containing protein [Allomuricauda taeanensis]MEE1964315.1 DUF4365 domain-containing protein [Allomuricauda taeanensis]
MDKIFNSKPAKFPNNNTEEYKSVIKLLDILDKNQIKPDPKLIDKFPNTDGECSITDKEQFPIGKVEIQIKTLPDSEVESPKYQCDIPFLSHCETSLLPVILIPVNTKNELAYWLHLDREILEDLGKRIKGESIVVHIPKENKITREDTKYVEKWTEIVKKYIRKKIDSDTQESYKKKYEELYKLYESFPKPIHSIGEDNLKSINIFIDTLNYSLDNDFKSIKEVVFPGFWKISIAYTDFNKDKISYAIIPIKYGDNNLLIREVSSMSPLVHDRLARTVTSHYASNPIKDKPVDYAFGLIKKETLEVIKTQSLKLVCEQLVFEYLTDFFDYTKIILPISDKENFSVKEFRNTIIKYLPIWIEEYNNFRNRPLIDSTIFFDIEEVFWHTLDKDKDRITEKANVRFKNSDFCNLKIVDTSKVFSFKYLIDSLTLLQNINIPNFKRPYPKKNYSKNSGFVWSWYTPETAFEKLSFVFKELPKVYDLFIDSFFPKLKEELKFYSEFKLLIINIKYGSEFKTFQDSPSIEMFYLDTKEDIKPTTQIFLNSIDCPVKWENHYDYFQNGIEIEKVKYELKSSSGGVIEYLYNKFTLREYLYKTLQERFEKYFKTTTSE